MEQEANATTLDAASEAVQLTTGQKNTDERLCLLISMANELGYVIQPVKTWEKILAHSIFTRLRKRSGEFVMQSAAFAIQGFPHSVAELLFPSRATFRSRCRHAKLIHGGSSQNQASDT